MAERRMFAKTIVLSDAFLDMPLSTRCLYFTLGMLADDDGFINSPKSIMRQCGASIDDLNLLVAKKFIIPFENGVVVIKHWRIHNYIQKDRYKGTKYIEEKNTLAIDEKGAYTTNKSDVSILDTQVRLSQVKSGEDSIVEDNTPQDEPSDTVSEEFEYIWGRYPRKEGKKAALASYKRARKKGVEYTVVLNGVINYLSYIKAKKIEPQFIKQGSTWFNGEHWNDEYDYSAHDNPPAQTSSNPFLDILKNGE